MPTSKKPMTLTLIRFKKHLPAHFTNSNFGFSYLYPFKISKVSSVSPGPMHKARHLACKRTRFY